MPEAAWEEHDDVLGRAFDRRLASRLWAAARPHHRLVWGSVALFPFITLLELAQPYLLKIAIDEHILRADWAGLTAVAMMYAAVLSGGQRQRVALARALISHPRLLLLDEPLGSLDALTRLEMQQLLEEVWRDQGFTAVLVTHDVSEAAALADRIILLDGGRISATEAVPHARPRRRGDAALAEIEGRILARLMRRSGAQD